MAEYTWAAFPKALQAQVDPRTISTNGLYDQLRLTMLLGNAALVV